MKLSTKKNHTDFFNDLEKISKHIEIMHWFNTDDTIITGYYQNFGLPMTLINNQNSEFPIYKKAYENQTKDVMWKIDILFEKIPEIKELSILDLACGTGIYSMELVKRGCKNVTGIDINPIQIKHANYIIDNTVEFEENKPKFECVNISADSSNFLAGRKFDLVLSFGLFYHLENPFRYLRNLNNLTNKYLFFQTATHQNNLAQDSLEFKIENAFENVNGISRMGLIPHFNLVPKLLKNAGFIDIEMQIAPYFGSQQKEMIDSANENKKYNKAKLNLWDRRFNGPKFFYYFVKNEME